MILYLLQVADSSESLRRRSLVDDTLTARTSSGGADRGAAALGTAASFGALLSAAACCVLPLALAAVGLGAGGLVTLVPFHWPLTILALVAVATAWLLYARRKRACASGPGCAAAPPSRATFLMLCLSTVFVALSAFWGFIEAPLMRLLGSA